MIATIAGPALFAGLVAIGATVAVERLGGRLGGVLASIPTTIVPASWGLFVGASRIEAAQDALGAVPAGMLVDAAFLVTWRVLPSRLPSSWSLGARLGVMTVLSLAVWFTGAVLYVLAMGRLADAGVAPVTVGVLATLALVAVGIGACLTHTASPRGRRPVGPWMLLSRGALAATAIAVSLAIAAAGAPLAAGVASVFPAIFLTTMVSLWIAQGEAVPMGAVGPIILGSSSVSVYALLAALVVPSLGLSVGTVTSWGAAVAITSVPAALWLGRSPLEAP